MVPAEGAGIMDWAGAAGGEPTVEVEAVLKGLVPFNPVMPVIVC